MFHKSTSFLSSSQSTKRWCLVLSTHLVGGSQQQLILFICKFPAIDAAECSPNSARLLKRCFHHTYSQFVSFLLKWRSIIKNWHLCNFVYFKEVELFFSALAKMTSAFPDLGDGEYRNTKSKARFLVLWKPTPSPYMHQNRFVDPVIPLVWRIPTGLWIPIFQFAVIVLEARQNVN